MWHLNPLVLLAHCEFEKTATLATIVFEVLVLAGSAATYLLLTRWYDRLWLRFLVAGIGVFIFELFTGPMWLNERLGPWAYLYYDVSWILTIGWTSLILGVVLTVDKLVSSRSEWQRYLISLGCLLVLVVPAEIIVVNLGIRSYAPEVLQAVSGRTLFRVPVEIFYYVPVFTSLVIGFYKYWSFVIDDAALVPVRRRKWIRAFLLALVAVFCFELMVEPMARNVGFPSWSYVFHDITCITIGTWVLLIAVASMVVGQLLMHLPIPVRFVAALLVIGGLALPIESWLISNGYRIYSASAVERFTGYTTPITGLAVEVAFAIPCYLALVIAFIRYWEIVMDNGL